MKFLLKTIIKPFAPIIPKSILSKISVCGLICLQLPNSKKVYLQSDGNDYISSLLYWGGIDAFEGNTIKLLIELLNYTDTVFDIGANTGWFSLILAHAGASVISFDRDEESINQLYSYVSEEKSDVLPLIMDIRQPSPEYELNIGTIPAAAERCKSELVMALGIIHHMVHTQDVTIEHLAYMLDAFAEKYVLVEFAPLDDAWAHLPSFTPENWNIQLLQSAFSKYFSYIGSWDSFPEGRKLLLFQKSNTG